MSDHLLSHSNSFGFEMEIDTAGCRAYDRNFIVGGEQREGTDFSGTENAGLHRNAFG